MFSQLLGVEDWVLSTYQSVVNGTSQYFSKVEKLSNESEVFKLANKLSLLIHVKNHNQSNLQDSNKQKNKLLWFPEWTFSKHKSEPSPAEQHARLQYFSQSSRLRFFSADDN